MIAMEGGHRHDAVIELAKIREATQEERCTMDEKSKEAEFWKSTDKGMYDEYLEETHKLHEHLKNREAMLKQEESFVHQLDADNEELRTFKRLEIQEASNRKEEHRERGVVKRPEKGPQLNSVREDKKMTGIFPIRHHCRFDSLPSFGDPMIDVHLSRCKGLSG